MRLAVIQHALTGVSEADIERLVALVAAAAERGADLTVVPSFPLSATGPTPGDIEQRVSGLGTSVVLAGCTDASSSAQLNGANLRVTDLGGVGVLTGDACFEPAEWQSLVAHGAEAVVLSPGAENDLQVEAVFELALQLSDALAGLVVVAERWGALPGEPGHGGSAIVLMGDIMAEALGGDDILIADVATPIPQPEPREALPEVPLLLTQRLAHHLGHKMPVDYPADLSDTIGGR